MLSKSIHIEDQVISRLKNGDDQAFREIFDLYHQPLYRLAIKYLRDSQKAEDALQDIFIKLWINRHTLNEDLSVKGFLFTSLKNHLLNTIRNGKVEKLKHAELSQIKIKLHNDTDNTLLLDEYQNHIQKGINQLSPQRQHIFNMRMYMGLTNQEISQKLNISINTVKFQLSQATKSIRDYLKRYK